MLVPPPGTILTARLPYGAPEPMVQPVTAAVTSIARYPGLAGTATGAELTGLSPATSGQVLL
jgi:hypothetical protein